MQYATPTNRNSATFPAVQFVECPVTKENAVLHQGLGVPSLPYGHIYHPTAGLVEEVKINKNVFATFECMLESYVRGSCPVQYLTDDDDNVVVVLDTARDSIV